MDNLSSPPGYGRRSSATYRCANSGGTVVTQCDPHLSTSLLLVTCVVLIAGCRRSGSVEYHSDVSAWEAADLPQAGGFPMDRIWVRPYDASKNTVVYADTDQDGIIDMRTEHRKPDMTVTSYDDNRDGRFDRESVHIDGARNETRIDYPVPRT